MLQMTNEGRTQRRSGTESEGQEWPRMTLRGRGPHPEGKRSYTETYTEELHGQSFT